MGSYLSHGNDAYAPVGTEAGRPQQGSAIIKIFGGDRAPAA